MATLPALSAAETRAAEALLDRVWGPGTSVHAAEPIWDRSHVVRLHLAAGRSVVMKRRAGTDGFGVELAALAYLVHGDACPDNVRFLDGRCRIFDSGRSGWGAVVLDASCLLAPFPSCWCPGRLPASVAAPAMSACRRRLEAAGTGLGPLWDAAMTAAPGAWIVAWGTRSPRRWRKTAGGARPRCGPGC